MFLFNYYKNLILTSRKWILVILLLFFVGFISGLALSVSFPQISAKIISTFSASLDKDLKPGLGESLYIFKRNAQIVIVSSLSGIVLGVFPLFTTYVNGFLLGVVVGFGPIYKALSPWQLLWLLIPHGLVEYSATFLSMAFGLRLGLNWTLPKNKGKRSVTFLKNLRETFAILFLCIGLLVLAAVIEGMLTARIACFIAGICR